MNGTSAVRSTSLSVVIATAFRESTLRNTLRSVGAQTAQPVEVVVVDGAPPPGVESVVESCRVDIHLNIKYLRSAPPSAARQRNVGVAASSGDIVLFVDDDAYPEKDCFEKILQVLEADSARQIGGVGVLIRNQPCPSPSRLAKCWFDYLADEQRASYSGAIVGPAVSVGPEPTIDGAVVPVEWLNSGCTAFRRTALPAGGFDSRFSGYSYMEDVDLSARVARRFILVVHTGAYMFHDTQPSRFKRPYTRARMVTINRYHVMTATLGRTSPSHHVKFLASLVVPLLASLISIRSPRAAADWILSCGGLITGLCELGISAVRRALIGGIERAAHF
jgi:GT2 family glycosyltransferase